MNKRRLLKLADLLEADAKNPKGVKFDLGKWGRSIDDESPASVSCGTAACAMGLAVLSGAFKRAGLRNSYGGIGQVRVCPEFGGKFGFDAAEALFEIDASTSIFLFADTSYAPLKQKGAAGERFVAKRIRDFVAGKVSAA